MKKKKETWKDKLSGQSFKELEENIRQQIESISISEYVEININPQDILQKIIDEKMDAIDYKDGEEFFNGPGGIVKKYIVEYKDLNIKKGFFDPRRENEDLEKEAINYLVKLHKVFDLEYHAWEKIQLRTEYIASI